MNVEWDHRELDGFGEPQARPVVTDPTVAT